MDEQEIREADTEDKVFLKATVKCWMQLRKYPSTLQFNKERWSIIMAFDSAKRVISGTWGEVWLDGEYVGECYALQAKHALQKKMCSNADKWKLTAKFSQLKVPALWRCIKYPAEWLI